MTRAETFVLRTLERGSYPLGGWEVRDGVAEDGETRQLWTKHLHFEPASRALVDAEVGLVPVAGGRAWFGVCTCGQHFLYDPSPPNALCRGQGGP